MHSFKVWLLLLQDILLATPCLVTMPERFWSPYVAPHVLETQHIIAMDCSPGNGEISQTEGFDAWSLYAVATVPTMQVVGDQQHHHWGLFWAHLNHATSYLICWPGHILLHYASLPPPPRLLCFLIAPHPPASNATSYTCLHPHCSTSNKAVGEYLRGKSFDG